MNRFVLVLHGPICGGKTTLARHLGSRSKLFILGSDRIKWCISDFSIRKYAGTGIVNALLFRLIEEAIEQDFSVVVEGNLRFRTEKLDSLIALCERRGLPLIQVNIEAPLPVVEERFGERLRRSIRSGTKLAVQKRSSASRMYRRYLDDRDAALPNMDSSTMTLEEMAEEVDNLIRAEIDRPAHFAVEDSAKLVESFRTDNGAVLK